MTPFTATLTATDNPYLSPNLPLRGELQVGEVGTDGSIRWATFRIEYADGTLGPAVAVGGSRRLRFRVGGKKGALSAPPRYSPNARAFLLGQRWTKAERRANRLAQQ
jgi:hypothetical protein